MDNDEKIRRAVRRLAADIEAYVRAINAERNMPFGRYGDVYSRACINMDELVKEVQEITSGNDSQP